MKVPVIYQPDAKEINVSVSLDDIRAALAEHPESSRQAMMLVNDAYQAIESIPDALINGMSVSARRVIAEALRRQALRFCDVMEGES